MLGYSFLSVLVVEGTFVLTSTTGAIGAFSFLGGCLRFLSGIFLSLYRSRRKTLRFNDIATVAKLAGHADVKTTAKYDRRSEESKRRTAGLLHFPYLK